MKQIIPEIYIKDCKIAIDYYQTLFGGKIKNLQMSDELEMFNEVKGKVVHSELHINTKCVIYFVDIFDKKRASVGNVTIMLHFDSLEEVERIYASLSDGGKIGMPLQKTFWGAHHAIVTDKYGAPWALNYAEKVVKTK